ncbi:MAG: bacillithiol system redox-active protein YtxJ [Flavobacteriales bacterium]|nr:bacillithiol system redox-active protein YtxJ [Flavobacteriales bacterium]
MALFGNSNSGVDKRWTILDSDDVLTQILEDISGKAVVLFKHSTTCGISGSVKRFLENEWEYNNGEFEFYYLDLLMDRPISNRIMTELQVVHESPQIIVVRNGKVLYHASHGNITMGKIVEALTSN